MKRTGLFTVIAIISAAAVSLIGAIPASAASGSASHLAARALPAAAPAAHLPAGTRLARVPPAGTGLPYRLPRLRPNDAVGCYDHDSILSAANGRWVSAELGYTGGNYAMLRARATAVGPWEQYLTATARIGC